MLSVHAVVLCLPIWEMYCFYHCRLSIRPFKANHCTVNYANHHLMTQKINVTKTTHVWTQWYVFRMNFDVTFIPVKAKCRKICLCCVDINAKYRISTFRVSVNAKCRNFFISTFCIVTLLISQQEKFMYERSDEPYVPLRKHAYSNILKISPSKTDFFFSNKNSGIVFIFLLKT